MIVVGAPSCRNCAAGMAQRREQIFVQTLLAHPSVVAFDQTGLHWLAWCDVVPADFAVLQLFQHRIAGQFGAVVTDHHARIATQLGDAIQFTGDAMTAD